MRMTALFLAAMLVTTGAAAHELKVATWNIEHLRDGIGEGPNPRDQADFDRLEAYAEILDADVIAFQEVENQAPLCWDRKFDLFIDHIVLDRQAARWIRLHTFEQVVYQEDETLENKLSDHCPIAVVIETR
jgi:exonuclease III